MGTHTWYLCTKIVSPDGVAAGVLGPFHMTFKPSRKLLLARYGIYRDPEQDSDPEIIRYVVSVYTRNEGRNDHFLVYLDEDQTAEKLSDAMSLYGADWDWKIYPNEDENP
jgi:hypothetical protein